MKPKEEAGLKGQLTCWAHLMNAPSQGDIYGRVQSHEMTVRQQALGPSGMKHAMVCEGGTSTCCQACHRHVNHDRRCCTQHKQLRPCSDTSWLSMGYEKCLEGSRLYPGTKARQAGIKQQYHGSRKCYQSISKAHAKVLQTLIACS